jgi:uncharacterized protein (TIGR00251 family)
MIQLTIRVVPRASKPGIAGTRGGALLVRLQSAPVEGAANEELVALLAQTFGVARRDVRIVAGEHSRVKRVTLEAIERRGFELVLQALGINSQDLH